MKKIVLIISVFWSVGLYAQNTAITDNDSYTPHSSAMLDVYSLSKGLLVPRLTAAQRVAIATPADGLLVYDTDADHYYYFANSVWNPIDAPSLWSENNDTIFITGDGKRYGVGTASPLARLTVQGDATIAPDEPLFEVKNSAGDVIFAVYENEVKVNFKESTKGVKGGFAVGGLSGTKAEPVEYMRITPDSVRIYIDDSGTKGVKGGFAVGGLSGTKGGNQYFKLDDESASIYLRQPAKGVKGGFAVGGLSGTKGSEDFLTIARDSARIYIDDAAKGVKGGFAVGGLSGTKAGSNFLDLTPDNYFIGHQAGIATTPGLGNDGRYNSFFGYEAGMNNVSGYQNIFIGYNAGKGNVFGFWNTFLGVEAGKVNTGSDNTFIGYRAGSSHQSQGGNVHIGSKAGEFATNGEQNIFIGESSGSYNLSGGQNVFMGFKSGFSNQSGSSNVFIGNEAGRTNTAGANNVFLGYYAGYTNNASNNVFLGNEAGRFNSSGTNNAFMGYFAGRSNTSGSNNVFIGNEAGRSNTTGYSNVFIGNKAGYKATKWESVFIGNEAGYNTTTPVRNVFIGNQAGYTNVTGQYNTYVGESAGKIGTGFYNTILGAQAGSTKDFGNSNVLIGYVAGRDIVSDRNILIGQGAGYNNKSTLGHNIFIGYQAGRTLSDTSYRLAISDYDNPILIYGEFDNNRVAINGTNTGGNTFYVNGSAGGSGGWNTKADMNAKSNIERISGALDKVMKLEGFSFIWKDESDMGRQLGLNGQDVKEIIPEVVGDEESGYAIQYGALTPLLIEAMKEQQKQIEELKKANSELRELIKSLK